MVGRPKKEQDQEAIELIEKLKEELGCKTDTELANAIGVDKSHVSRWKIRGFTERIFRVWEEEQAWGD